jgi:multimeric flavodoxin WrbA
VPRLLVVHHTSSPALQAMLEAVLSGARDPELERVDVAVVPALAATVPDVLAADGFVLGTPANIGYMSGALKHFFDQIYYPCLQAKAGAPYGLYVHGASDTTGAVRAVAAIAKGLGWAEVVKPVVSTGAPAKDVERQCYELGATVAANLGPLPPGAGFLHGQLSCRVGLEPVLRDGLAAEHGETVVAGLDPPQRPVDRGEPFAQLVGDVPVVLLFRQRQPLVSEVSRAVRRLLVEALGFLGLPQQCGHLGPLCAQQSPCPALVHASPLPR